MRKLLYASTVPGTLKHFLTPFAAHFRANGWQVDAAASNASRCPVCSASFDRVWDIDWTRSPFALGRLHSAAEEIHRVVTRERYDLVHVHTPVASFVTRYALRNHPRRPIVVYTAHGFHFHQGGGTLGNWLFLQLEKTAGRWTDYLVTINREDHAAASRHRIVPDWRLKYMPGIGVDRKIYAFEETTARDAAQLRRSLGMTDDDRLFLTVGELNQNKRPGLVLDAFAALPVANIHLAFAGPGPLERELRIQAERLRVQERTHFLGARRDIPVLLAAASALVLASRREGLPRSIMEALCMERPCIGSDVRGTRDLLADGCGVIFRPDDRDGLTQAMAWVLDHPEEARTMALNGQAKMRDFDIHRILQLHEDLYEEALAGA